MAKEKIVILGGGIAALTAAFELTSIPNWQDHYDITLYQMGWRLGGKGASGRDPQHHFRIEEHGLHIWFGVYQNAFSLLRRAYTELNRPSTTPFPTLESAFQPLNSVTIWDEFEGVWQSWQFNFPANAEFPDVPLKNDRFLSKRRILAKTFQFCQPLMAYLPSTNPHLLRRWQNWANRQLGRYSKRSRKAQRQAILLDLGLTIFLGILRDGVLSQGWQTLNRYDFKEWLAKNNANDFTVNSTLVNAIYGLLFGYEGGDIAKPNMAAGNLMQIGLRMIFTYRGSILYKMYAGMGDIVIAPLYLVLKQRGVKFKFFHRVTKLRTDGINITSIEMGQQVNLSVDEYDPLILVQGLPCWPSKPLYQQIVEGEQLKVEQINLESRWANWQDVENITLTAGKDFDKVILGISIAALKDICEDLIVENQIWADMVEKVKTVQTQAAQLWFKPSTDQLGDLPPTYSMSGYLDPFNSWADFSQVLPQENQISTLDIHSLHYGTDVLSDDFTVMPPPSDHSFPQEQAQRVKHNLLTLLQERANDLWPLASQPSGALDWSKLAAPDNLENEERVGFQYWRANIDPTERYVLSVKGSDHFRLKTNQSGYLNLYLVGTWINSGYNMSSVEIAVMTGMMASRAICSYPQTIANELDSTKE